MILYSNILCVSSLSLKCNKTHPKILAPNWQVQLPDAPDTGDLPRLQWSRPMGCLHPANINVWSQVYLSIQYLSTSTLVVFCTFETILLMEEILHRRGHIWQYTITCTPAPPFQCCVLKLCAPVQDFSHSTSLFWALFLTPMLNGEHEGLDFKCIWWCRIFSINRLQKSCLLVFRPSQRLPDPAAHFFCAPCTCSPPHTYIQTYRRTRFAWEVAVLWWKVA